MACTGAILSLFNPEPKLPYAAWLMFVPAIVASLEHQQKAESFAQIGSLAGALDEVEQSLVAIPRDPEQLVFKGLLTLVRDVATEETFAAAEEQVSVVGSSRLAHPYAATVGG